MKGAASYERNQVDGNIKWGSMNTGRRLQVYDLRSICLHIVNQTTIWVLVMQSCYIGVSTTLAGSEFLVSSGEQGQEPASLRCADEPKMFAC